MSSYSYSSENRLENPCSYMYTPFVGPSFISDYRASRNLIISQFEAVSLERFPMGAETPAFPQVCVAAGPLPLLTADSIKMAELLAAILNQLSHGKCDEPCGVWLDLLAKRFEISKSIYSEYGPGLRKGKGDKTDLALYAMAALVLSLGVSFQASRRYLNGLLKINDLICSVPDKVTDTRDVATVACFALGNELILTGQLMEENGIEYETD
jgi:hypothetical protein